MNNELTINQVIKLIQQELQGSAEARKILEKNGYLKSDKPPMVPGYPTYIEECVIDYLFYMDKYLDSGELKDHHAGRVPGFVAIKVDDVWPLIARIYEIKVDKKSFYKVLKKHPRYVIGPRTLRSKIYHCAESLWVFKKETK